MLKHLLLTTGLALTLTAPTFAHAADQADQQGGSQSEAAGAESGTQATDKQTTDEQGSASAEEGTIITEQETDQVLVQELLGKSVVNQKGESLGTVTDVVLDREGQVAGVVLASGGFLGIGAKPVGVAWNDLTAAMNRDAITVDLTAKQIAEAPEFKTKAEKEAERKAKQQQQMQQQQQQQQQQGME